MSYQRNDIGHNLCQSRCVCVYSIHHERRQMCVCVYRSNELASEGRTAVISVIFVFCLFRRPGNIFFGKEIGSQSKNIRCFAT